MAEAMVDPSVRNADLWSSHRHSTAHLMAAAIEQLWPEAQFGVGPAVEHGFYYDVLLPTRITEEDSPKSRTACAVAQQEAALRAGRAFH